MSPMNKKSLLILEIIWTATGLLSLVAAITSVASRGLSSTFFVFIIMAVVAFVFAFLRHRQRRNL